MKAKRSLQVTSPDSDTDSDRDGSSAMSSNGGSSIKMHSSNGKHSNQSNNSSNTGKLEKPRKRLKLKRVTSEIENVKYTVYDHYETKRKLGEGAYAVVMYVNIYLHFSSSCFFFLF